MVSKWILLLLFSRSVVSNSLWPHGLYSIRLCPWDFPGKNPGVGSHFLLQGNLPESRIEPASAAWQVDSLPLSHLGSPSKWIHPLKIEGKRLLLNVVLEDDQWIDNEEKMLAPLSSFKLLFIYLVALGRSCGMWDLVPWPGIKPGPPALGAQSLTHWTTREVTPNSLSFSAEGTETPFSLPPSCLRTQIPRLFCFSHHQGSLEDWVIIIWSWEHLLRRRVSGVGSISDPDSVGLAHCEERPLQQRNCCLGLEFRPWGVRVYLSHSSNPTSLDLCK